MTTTIARRLAAAALLPIATSLLLALGGCVALPESAPRPPSHAIADDGTTALSRLVAASRPKDTPPAQSGFRLMPTANDAFAARLELIRRAERSLDVQYYLLQHDAVGRRFLRGLAEAADRGVRVRLLVDDLYTGGEEAWLSGLAARANVEIRVFNPLPARTGSVLARIVFSRHEFGRINHRMHNKLMVADGVLSVSGGRNLADEYFMSSGQANFIDIDVVSTGPVVAEFQAAFDAYWNSRHVYPIGEVFPRVDDADAARVAFDADVAGEGPPLVPYPRDPLGAVPFTQQAAAGRLTQTLAPARVFFDPPDKVDEGPDSNKPSAVMRNTLAVIGAAEREAVLVSPYFIPGDVGMPMMRAAAGKGVRTILYTNALGANDEPLVHARYARYRREMLQLGVEIHEISPTLAREHTDFGDFGRSFARLHAKAAVIDRRHVLIGSMNLDGRSAIANTELGMVIDSPALAEAFSRLVAAEKARSMFRLRLAADGRAIEWVSLDSAGREVVISEEPDDSWWRRFKLLLLAPFTAEELL